MLITLERMVYFDHILHTYVFNICLTTGMRNRLFLLDVALLSISSAGRGQLVKMLITLEPHGIFGTNYTLDYLKRTARLMISIFDQKELYEP